MADDRWQMHLTIWIVNAFQEKITTWLIHLSLYITHSWSIHSIQIHFHTHLGFYCEENFAMRFLANDFGVSNFGLIQLNEWVCIHVHKLKSKIKIEIYCVRNRMCVWVCEHWCYSSFLDIVASFIWVHYETIHQISARVRISRPSLCSAVVFLSLSFCLTLKG